MAKWSNLKNVEWHCGKTDECIEFCLEHGYCKHADEDMED